MARKLAVAALVAGLLVLAQCAATADHINLPVKWSQRPDMGARAFGLRAEHRVVDGGQVVADDWMCNDPRPIAAVRWWGSYLRKAYEPTTSRYLPFELSIHTGDSVPPPNSEPGMNPEMFFVEAQEDFYGVDAKGNNVYEYNAYLTWVQQVGQVYWLDVQLDVSGLGWPFYTWGWHNTDEPWRANSVYSTVSHNGPWTIDCAGQAFELMVPEPGSLAALAVGALGLAGCTIRRRRIV